jgi:hypothetical protein
MTAALLLAAIVAVVGVLLPSPASASTPSVVGRSLVSVEQVTGWDDARWTQEFTDLKAAGISELILNGAVVAGAGSATAYYPATINGVRQATDPGGHGIDVVHTVLDHARTAGMTVWLGTYIPDSNWFSPSDATVAAMASANASLTADVLRDLDRRYAEYAGTIAGWYLGSEVGAGYAWSWTAGTALSAYFGQLVAAGHAAGTAQKVMTSPYYNVEALPDGGLWTSMWTRILAAAPIDVIALQDGTGDGGAWRSPGAETSQIVQKFAATRAAIASTSPATQLWDNADLYDVAGNAKPIADVARAIQAARPYIDGTASWSFTSNYSPWTLGTDAYATPFGAWNAGRPLNAQTPTDPAALSRVPDGASFRITWNPSAASTGNVLAYYRVATPDGTPLAEGFSPSWTGADSCVTVQAVDTAGNVSHAVPTC